MDVNVDKALLNVIRTGKVKIGANSTIDAVAKGEAKMVVVADNCPAELKEKLEDTNVPVYVYPGTSVDLGRSACGKPFTISALAVIDAGESDILALI
ncbi:50S ribosomal protein L30e [Methanohalophilus sp.]|uniref:50S ribosomal protein L30e n=1 Tax=Methanohalophilus sp. TaxID=1966352 RepID=UPI0026095FEE|nr:50S ribosomal protein L30e [Methanohalophilus sp.]MDK2893109.1 large subunit ribosomal protein L30e [Methanohalophilus sp.]